MTIIQFVQKEQSGFHRLLLSLGVGSTLLSHVGFVLLGFNTVMNWAETPFDSTVDLIVSCVFSYTFSWLWILYLAAVISPPWYGKEQYFIRLTFFSVTFAFCYISLIVVPVLMVIISGLINPQGFPSLR